MPKGKVTCQGLTDGLELGDLIPSLGARPGPDVRGSLWEQAWLRGQPCGAQVPRGKDLLLPHG